MKTSRLIFTSDAAGELKRLIEASDYSNVAVVTDTNVARLVLPKLMLGSYPTAIMNAGEENKNIETLTMLWRRFVDFGITRHSLIINIGGGVVTDIGGFAASTFKRGVQFINVPTTLLCAVDAAIGGKTGIDFVGLKNEIGAFCPAITAVYDSSLFDTLPAEQLLSGYGEMVKHSLLDTPESYNEMLSLDILSANAIEINRQLKRNVALKQRIVNADPFESGPRKALNLGHTAGHALEQLMLRKNRTVSHGAAVACGIFVAMILSHLTVGFPSAQLDRYAAMLKRYGFSNAVSFGCENYDELLDLMRHDKKNHSTSEIRFTLLKDIGKPLIDCPIVTEKIKISLDIYRDFTGL